MEFLNVLYKIIKHIVEGIISTVLVSIAWGWSLTHLRHENHYIIVGTVVTLLNVMVAILECFLEPNEHSNHSYDHVQGVVLLFLRLTVLALFVVGILRSLSSSVGRMKQFLKRFALEGGAFLISWPLAALLAELFLPAYMQREVVTVIDEASHLVATAYLCRLFAIPGNYYKKVNMKNEE